MSELDFDTILKACQMGGPSCLSVRTELVPAAGPEASVAPAKYSLDQQDAGTYLYEKRFIDTGDNRKEVRDTVLIDSKQSQINRVEAALLRAIVENNPPNLSRMPRVEVVYRSPSGEQKKETSNPELPLNTQDGPDEDVTNKEGMQEERLCDLELPHRVFDGHIRAGKVNGKRVVDHDLYVKIRNATPANARVLLDTSPATLIFGGWDATRKGGQARWRSALVGEIIGVCADRYIPKKGTARIDPLGARINLSSDDIKDLAEIQGVVLKSTRGNKHKASEIVLGGIKPVLNQLGGVSCERIIRSQVLSFATLRQIRFGGSAEADASFRALLASIALYGLALANSELYLRANCDLREAGPSEVLIDNRSGGVDQFDPLTVDTMCRILDRAFEKADEHGLGWSSESGIVLSVDGDPRIRAAASDDTANGDGGDA